MTDEKNTIDLAIKNLDKSSEVLMNHSYSQQNYNTVYGEMLSAMSHEMWCLSRKMKNFKEQYVL